MHDQRRLNNLIQYSLLRAGEEDVYASRRLGPIHIIKYIYLADLYYSEKHGVTFTGINWQFYNFGPWSSVVNSSIPNALSQIMANKACLESMYKDDDCFRWDKQDTYLLRDKARDIPAEITSRLNRDIHSFTNDTKALLDFVYQTEPMLSAKPCANLKFKQVQRVVSTEPSTRIDNLSNKKKKNLRQKLAALKERNQGKQRVRKLTSPVENPRYDEVYRTGINWLNELDNTPKLEKEIVVEFSDDVWLSETRKSYELS